MRLILGAAVLSVSALALAGCGDRDQAKAPAADGPATTSQSPAPIDMAETKRKPGLWRMATTAAGVVQSMRLCTDAATEEKFAVWGGQASKDMCSRQEMTRGLDGTITFTSVCDMGSGGVTTTTGTIKGDFDTQYAITAKTVTTGAGAPQMNGERDMIMEATWLGPCPSDFKPGDMEVAEGMKFNILEMNARNALGGGQ
jgi:hypothetical protein